MYLLELPTNIALSKPVFGLDRPLWSYCGCRTPFSHSHQDTLKKIKVYYLQDLEITQHACLGSLEDTMPRLGLLFLLGPRLGA